MTAQTVWGVLPVVERVMVQLRGNLSGQITATLAEGSVPAGLRLPPINPKAIGLGDWASLPLAHPAAVRVVPDAMAVRSEARVNVRSQRGDVRFLVRSYVSIQTAESDIDPTYQTHQTRAALVFASAVRAVVERTTGDQTQGIASAIFERELLRNVEETRGRSSAQVWTMVEQAYTCTVKMLQSRGSAPS